MKTLLTSEDIKFIRLLTRRYHIGAIKISYSPSKKQWPDIWCEMNGTHTITVTDEWRRQGKSERHKRLVHEFEHFRGLEHGMYGKLDFNTIPSKDSWSRKVHRDIVGG